MKLFRVFWFHFKSHLQRTFEYRLSLILWVLNGFLGPLTSLVIWLNISKSSNFPLTSSDLITYFLSSTLVFRLTQSWSLEHFGERIKRGGFSWYLLRPSPYFLNDLANNFSTKVFRISILFPFLIIFYIIFKTQIRLDLLKERFFLFLLASLLGFLVRYILENAIALIAFWTTEINGIGGVFEMAFGFFSGSFIPIVLMPNSLRKIMIFLPFRFIVSFPIEVFLKNFETNILEGFIIGIGWVIIGLILWRFLLLKGIKKYSAVGG